MSKNHPSGKKIKPESICPLCPHTLVAHTEKTGGCAYCTCHLVNSK